MKKLGAVILTGGASSRMGEDKARSDWLGKRAIDRVFGLALEVGSAMVITAGRLDYGLPFVADPAPLGGPVGGILGGLDALRDQACDTGLVLAVDAPSLRVNDIDPLIAQASTGACYSGYPLPMVVPTHFSADGVSSNWPVARLVAFWGLTQLTPELDAVARVKGANTPEERHRLLQALAAHEASLG